MQAVPKEFKIKANEMCRVASSWLREKYVRDKSKDKTV